MHAYLHPSLPQHSQAPTYPLHIYTHTFIRAYLCTYTHSSVHMYTYTIYQCIYIQTHSIQIAEVAHQWACYNVDWFSGFIMMTPQLFINYKLKSVAHLPWRMLTYKALNTFIDDIFAFIIKMPTLYRLGCLRDGEYCLLGHMPKFLGSRKILGSSVWDDWYYLFWHTDDL